MNPNNFFTSSAASLGLSPLDKGQTLFKPPRNAASQAESRLSLQESFSVSISNNASSGKQVFAKSIEYSLGLKVQTEYEPKIPSPKDVAKTVLGFVEKRINAEKASGASTEKLTNLLQQARAGVEQGYAQAEKDIKGLGLMTDELAKEISEGFELIGRGLDSIEKKVSDGLDLESQPQVSPVKQNASDSVNENADNFLTSSAKPSTSSLEKVSSLRQFSENSADMILQTRDGDRVLIRMADRENLAFSDAGSESKLSMAQASYFEFSIEGNLDEDEVNAINDLLEQVGQIASQFFSDDYEAAFESALNLGFDTGEIAAFSMELSKLQIQEVRVYEQGSKSALDSYKRHQPLINMAQQIEGLNSLRPQLARFEGFNSIVHALVDKAIDRYDLLSREQANDSPSNASLYKDLVERFMALTSNEGD